MPVCPNCRGNERTYCADWSERVAGVPVLDDGTPPDPDGKLVLEFPGLFVADSCSVTWDSNAAPGTELDPLCASVRAPVSGPNGLNVLDVLCDDPLNPDPQDGLYFGVGELNSIISACLSSGAGLVHSTCLGSDGDTTTQSFVVPPVLQNGDVVAHLSFKSDDTDPTFPLAGWTELGSQVGTSNEPDRGLSINYKVITDAATELAGVTWDFVSATADQNVGHLWVVRGVDNADPIDVHSFSNTFNTIDPFKTRAVTTTVDNAFIMSASYGGMQTGGAGTPEVVSAPPHVLTFDKYTPAAGGGFGQIVAGASFWVAGLAGLTTQDNYAMGGVHTRTWTSGETTLAFNPA